jgi:hypothetical protein
MRTRRLTRLVLVAVVGACSLAIAVPAGSASAIVPPPGTPDLSQWVLAPSDFAPGARVTKQGYNLTFAVLGVIGYERKLAGVSTMGGGARFTEVGSGVVLTPSAEVATVTFALLNAELRSPNAQQQTRAKTIREYGRRAHVMPRDVRFGSVRSLHVGDESILLPWSVRVHGVLHRDAAIRLRVDRVVGVLELTGVPRGRVSFTEAAGLAGKMADRIRAGLAPLNIAPLNSEAPAIIGTATQRQTLYASSGVWSNSPTSFAYQWERSDATGANCAPIAGASEQSYTLTAADAGMRVRVSVTATDAAGSSKATSTPTTIVR